MWLRSALPVNHPTQHTRLCPGLWFRQINSKHGKQKRAATIQLKLIKFVYSLLLSLSLTNFFSVNIAFVASVFTDQESPAAHEYGHSAFKIHFEEVAKKPQNEWEQSKIRKLNETIYSCFYCFLYVVHFYSSLHTSHQSPNGSFSIRISRSGASCWRVSASLT